MIDEWHNVEMKVNEGFARGYRDLSFVPRWSIIREIKGQSVAEHSYYVALYANEIAHQINWRQGDDADYWRSRLLQYALVHDVSDSYTGDWPGPAKRTAIYDRDVYEAWLDSENSKRFDLWRRHEIRNALDDNDIKSIIKCADLLDEAMYLAGELQMGNSSVSPMLHQVKDRLTGAISKLPCDPRVAMQLRIEMMTAVHEQQVGQSDTIQNDDDIFPDGEVGEDIPF